MWSSSHHFFHQCKHGSYLIRHVVYTLYFKLYSNSPNLSLTFCLTYSLSLFLSHTHAYTGLISAFFCFFFSLCLSLSPGLLTNKMTASGIKSAGHPRTWRAHTPGRPCREHLCTANKHLVVIALRHACWAKFKLIRWQPKPSHPGISSQRRPPNLARLGVETQSGPLSNSTEKRGLKQHN